MTTMIMTMRMLAIITTGIRNVIINTSIIIFFLSWH